MKTYNYYYGRQPIPKSQFTSAVPKEWEKDVKNGEYSWGYYKAVEIEPDELTPEQEETH